MYRITDAIYRLHYPIVFKGALVLKHIVTSYGVTDTFRGTKDIDCDWVNGSVSMDTLEFMVVNAVNSLEIPTLRVQRVRNADEVKNISASFLILNGDCKLFSIDISLKNNTFYTQYKTYNGLTFNGASVQKIIVDKMSAISSDKIKRRTKDVYDLYLITFLPNIIIKDIIFVGNKSGRILSDFAWFLSNKEDIRYDYSKMSGVYNKPDFDIMYNRVRDFCTPFITRRDDKNLNAIWQPEGCVWFPYLG